MPFTSVVNEAFDDGTLETGFSLTGTSSVGSGVLTIPNNGAGLNISGVITAAMMDDFQADFYGSVQTPNYNTAFIYLFNMQETAAVDYAIAVEKAAAGANDTTYTLRRKNTGSLSYTTVHTFGTGQPTWGNGIKLTVKKSGDGVYTLLIDDVQVGSTYAGPDDEALSSNLMGLRITSVSWGMDRIDLGTAGEAADTEAPTPDTAPVLNYDKHYPRVAMDFTDALTANVSTYAVILAHGSTAPSRAQVKAGTDASDADVGTGKKANATVASGTLHYLDLTEADITRGTIYAFAEDTEATPNQTTLYTIDKPELGAAATSGDETLLNDGATVAVENLQSQSNGIAVFGLDWTALDALSDPQMIGLTLWIHKVGLRINGVLGLVTDFDVSGGAASRLVTVAIDNSGYTIADGDVVEIYLSRQSYQASFADDSITAAKIASDAISEFQSGIATQGSLDAIATNGVPIAEGGVPGIYEGTVANNTAPSTAGFELSGGVEFDGQFVGSTIKLLSGNLAGTPLRITGSTASTNVITCVLRHNSGVLSAIPTVGAKYKIA